MSTSQWLRFWRSRGLLLARTRTVPLLAIGAVLAGSAYGIVSAPASFVVNAYYGEAYYNNQLNTTTLADLISAGATKNLTHLTYAFAQNNATSNDPCSGLPVAMNLSDLQSLTSQNPPVKILISIGGEGSDATFEAAISHYHSAAGFAQ